MRLGGYDFETRNQVGQGGELLKLAEGWGTALKPTGVVVTGLLIF